MFHFNQRRRWSALACALAAAAASASAAELRYEMAFYEERPGGPQIAGGDYAAAIAEAARRVRSRDLETALVAATNLCVAHTVRGELAAAAPRCDDAVRLARRMDDGRFARTGAHATTARALSNRGVLRAMTGDTGGAAADFVAAMRRTRAWDAPGRNLARLERDAQDRVARARDGGD
ncbi:MAG TPA: hypothetical protein VIN61_07430 [Gammaproteobacteria bacterium]